MRLVSINAIIFLLVSSCAAPEMSGQQKAVTPSGTSPAVVSMNAFQRDFLNEINKVRAKGCNCGGTFMPAVEPLVWNKQLERAAYLHAKDMNRNKYFSHISRSGKTSKDRIMDTGYTIAGFRSYAVGENIAWGQKSIQEVMKGWLKSEGHCKNLMNKTFKEVGISMENYYWVQDFGGRK